MELSLEHIIVKQRFDKTQPTAQKRKLARFIIGTMKTVQYFRKKLHIRFLTVVLNTTLLKILIKTENVTPQIFFFFFEVYYVAPEKNKKLFPQFVLSLLLLGVYNAIEIRLNEKSET